MSVRSLNKVILIGNLTRDPEIRYTPSGAAVCTFSIATNRSWVTQTGETKEEAEYHRIVAWNKLGELCGQLLTKGRKVYVEGRITSRTWTGQDGQQRTTVEIVIEDMIILDAKKDAGDRPTETAAASHSEPSHQEKKKPEQAKKQESIEEPAPVHEEISVDDIPF